MCKRIPLPAVGLTVLLGLAGCGGDDKSPIATESPDTTGSTGGSGGTSSGSSPAPLADKPGANAQITQGNALVVWTAASAALTRATTNAGGGGTVNGLKSGKAAVSGSFGDWKVVFDDYSDDGKNWVAGQLTYKIDGTKFTVKGRLEIAGEYQGSLDLDLVTDAGVTPPSVTGTINGVAIPAAGAASSGITTDSGSSGASPPAAITIQTLTVSLPGGASMEFAQLPAGKFLMGSLHADELARGEEEPQHEVTLSKGFYLGKYEVTQGQWEAVMGTKPWDKQNNVQANPNHPVVYVSWHDAQALVHKLNQAAGDSLYRLPTEAEWEYACRAGTTTPWSFGSDQSAIGEYAWYDTNTLGNANKYARPVGSKLPNPWGLHDMHGNVREWVQDWFGAYPREAATDPQITTPSEEGKLTRGGGIHDDPRELRSANRKDDAPEVTASSTGVRLVKIK
jgi:formylglycine-generating enzyme required for sulfatase activity